VPREAPQRGGDEDQDHRVEDVDREAVLGHEPGKPPAAVETLPEYDDYAEADRNAEEGLPEGAGGALPIKAPRDPGSLCIFMAPILWGWGRGRSGGCLSKGPFLLDGELLYIEEPDSSPSDGLPLLDHEPLFEDRPV